MKKLKIVDFDCGCGGFSKGFEDSNFFEVKYNGFLNEKNLFCYNNTHSGDFALKDTPPSDFDLAIFMPIYISFSSNKKSVKNFLPQSFSFIKKTFPANIFFITNQNIFPSLKKSPQVMKLSNNYPTNDIISCFLLDLGYYVYNFVIDGANFGLPQHHYYNIYWASRTIPENILIKNLYGTNEKPTKTVADFLSDIYDESYLSWHIPNYNSENICSEIKQGFGAKNTKTVSKNRGYVRLAWDKTAPSLSHDFYKTSSKSPSIHPLFNRPLTIREGARLFGLSDDFIWDNKLKNMDVALMIYNSFSPFISKFFAEKLVYLLKKYEQF